MVSSSRGGGVKGFFRQKKKSGSINKPPKGKALSKKSSRNQSIVSHDDGEAREEDVLKQFDMNMAYGPCVGISRLGRWERANRLGLNPPKDVERLLRDPKLGFQCLWDGRV